MNNELYKNLVVLLRMFKNRPYHLAKYLIENKALNDDFIKNVQKNESLTNFLEEDSPKVFLDINQMNEYYNSMNNEVRNMMKTKSKEDIKKSLNLRLEQLIIDEKYEEAAKLRDYIKKTKK